MLLFSESQSYCISEKYNKNTQRLTFCEIENRIQKTKSEFFMDCKNHKLLQLNDHSKIGWFSNDNFLTIMDLSKK